MVRTKTEKLETIVIEKTEEIERLEKKVKQQKAIIEELRNRLAYAIGRCKRR